MGQDVVLESKSYFEVTPGLKTVSSHGRSGRGVRDQERKQHSTNRNHHFKLLDPDLRELSRSYSSSICCESRSSKTFDGVNRKEVLKRGSMYQSSEEVRRMRKLREGRRKVDSVCRNDEFLSFEIVDSLPHSYSNEGLLLSHLGRSSLVSSNSRSVEASHSINTRSKEFVDLSFRDLPEKNSKTNDVATGLNLSKDNSLDDFLDICLHKANSETHRAHAPSQKTETICLKEQKLKCPKISLKSSKEQNCEAEMLKALPKSFSAKVAASNVASQLECGLVNSSANGLVNASPKTMSNPFQRFFDPIMKSKSLRNVPSTEIEPGNIGNDPSNIKMNKLSHKSLLSDLSKATDMESDAHLRGEKILTVDSSPAHLIAILKVETEDGNTSFDFSIKDTEDVLSAKMWRTDNAYSWAYTFHNFRKKNSARRRTKEKNGKSPPMIAQMQVSCYLCSEVIENGSLANSTVTEFVLYDIVQARRSFATEEKSQCSVQSLRSKAMVSLDRNNKVEHESPARRTSSNSDSDASISYPLSPTDLHPQLEIAATVIRTPFNKNDKFKDRKAIEMKEIRSLSSYHAVDPKKDTDCKNQNHPIVKVVTPSGMHGLPNTDKDGSPSTLLDRWRFGGGCDCGGWDMSCPVVILDNHHSDDWVDCLTLKSEKPMLLYVQGNKEKVPALSIMADRQGQYSVNFHAQLSALQAFSICIAILHSSEASSTLIHEKSRQRFFSSSLRLLLEEEVRQLLEAVAIEDKKKEKRAEQVPPAFALDLPFSPMSRV